MKKVYFDPARCLGCHSCEFACALEHSLSKSPAQAVREEVKPASRRRVRLVEGLCLTVACRHCTHAPCVDACMAGAMTKDPVTGEVTCEAEKCVSCWMCVMVCPFGAVRPGEVYTVKCDLCAARETYACVEACPTGALFVAGPEELQERRRQKELARKTEVHK